MSTQIVDAFCKVMGERDNQRATPTEDPHGFAGDIPLNLATVAHSGTSFIPETRGHQVRAGYAAELTSLLRELESHADTDDKRVMLAVEFARLRDGYRKRYLAYLASQSRTYSTMISGPSNFPVRRMEKRNRVVDARRTELIEFLPRAKSAILKALHPEWRPIMAGDGNATERLAAKIADAEKVQDIMRAANAAIRKHKKAGAEAQVNALVALGLGKVRAATLLVPDFCGRIGFADFELTNNNANIRRMKERLASVSKAKTADLVQFDGENAKYEDCPADNRVRLFFTGKPDESIRAGLKRNGFRWSPTIGAWQAYRNYHSIAHAKAVAGIPA
jgi:hypothetical protein